MKLNQVKKCSFCCAFIVPLVGWQEKPEESREYKGEWREEKKEEEYAEQTAT